MNRRNIGSIAIVNVLMTSRIAYALLTIACCTGCGVGEYESRMKSTLVVYQRTEKFAQLYGAETLAGGNVTVRIPQFFQAPKLVEVPGVPQPNVQPNFPSAPGYKIPGLVYTYEQKVVDDQGVTWPCYCYLAVLETRPAVQGQPGLSDHLAQQLAQAFPGLQPAWTEVDCETETGALGTTMKWYKLSAAGEMFFDREQNGKAEFVKQKGTYELWMYQAPNMYTVLLGWRIPDTLANKTPLEALKQRSAGSVTIKPPQAWPLDATVPLGNPATVGPYKIGIPANYQPKPARFTKPGATVLSWAAPGDAAQMTVVAYPPDAAFLSNEQVIKLAVREINPQLQVSPDPTQHGTINGLPAAQAKLASQGPFSGIAVAATNGAQAVVVYGEAAQGDPSQQLKQIMAAALSLTRAN